MSNTNRNSQLEKIEQAEKRLKARKQNIINKLKTDKRKLDTRMKILIGAIVLKKAAESERTRQDVKKMVSGLNERDQKAFETLLESWGHKD